MDVIERIQIPTPFSVGRVNCYAIPGNCLTVLDPGPATQEAEEELARSLTHLGYSLSDIEHILITHPHMDHFGLAQQIVEQSGAHVFAHSDAVDRLSDPIGYFKREQKYFRPFLLSMGMPTKTVDTVLELPESYTKYQSPVAVNRELDGDEILDVGIDLTCVSTPGHSTGSLCYLAASEDVIFTGDHVLPSITPNPLLTLAPGSNDERTRSLPTYIESLQKVLELDATVGYGGHGDPIQSLHDRVRTTITHHENRKERIAGLIGDREPVTAYQIMNEMFPDLPATEMFSGMSEVIGHFDLLEDEARVEITEIDGMKHYTLNMQ